jgi:hypothetical protein
MSKQSENAAIRGWGLFVVGAMLFFAGLASSSVLIAIGAWGVIIGLGFLAYGRWARSREPTTEQREP